MVFFNVLISKNRSDFPAHSRFQVLESELRVRKNETKFFENSFKFCPLFTAMSISTSTSVSTYEQLKELHETSKKYLKTETDKPSFFYFVEYCGKVKTITESIFQEPDEIESSFGSNSGFANLPADGKNLLTVRAVRSVSQKAMREQKIVARSIELPTSQAWTAAGVAEMISRIKKLEQTSDSKTEPLNHIESLISTKMTIGNYKSVRQLLTDALRAKKSNSKSSCEAVIPSKYRLFISREEIQTIDRLINFISGVMTEKEIAEIENMNYVDFKYSTLMFITALHLIYEFPPNYEIYCFCASLPKNPNENSELILKLNDLVSFTDSRMLSLMRIAKMYDKYGQHEAKVLEGK